MQGVVQRVAQAGTSHGRRCNIQGRSYAVNYNDGIADPIKIKEIMEARGGKDQYGNSYEFEIAGSILTIKPGNGLHEEVVTLDVTAKTAAGKSGV